jgi:hypothetical protein
MAAKNICEGRGKPRKSYLMIDYQLLDNLESYCDPGVYSYTNRNEYQKMFLGSKALPARKADNLTAICEPDV